MISRVIRNVTPRQEHRFVVLLQKDHAKGKSIFGCKTVLVDGVTEGAACTALLAKSLIDNPHPLMIVNSDQLLDWDPEVFIRQAQTMYDDVDGSIVTFTATDPKWSFVRKSGKAVVEVAEKRPISSEATAGIYYWRKGSDFVSCAEEMIAWDKRHNGEFYIAPVYNELISRGGYVTTFQVSPKAMHGLGTPEDLEAYLKPVAA